ncbi:hypothetical protein [Gilvimarinus japonicus]|uniref:Uncharacterized protein n=1 Tax=Gilvimarinus japonicus TaxID=1796469 RepID=A0ABV7HRQ3_9GAMM
MNWLAENQGPLSVLINAGMLAIWILYAQLLLRDYRRKLRPKVLINQSLGTALQSRCLICNMSEQSFYVSLVIAEIDVGDKTYRCSVTDLEITDKDRSKSTTVQGPLKGGDYRDMGEFDNIIQRIASEASQQDIAAQAQSLCIYVIGLYGSENQAVGANRRFCFSKDKQGNACLNPVHIHTENLTGRRHQKEIRRWLENYL